MLLLRPCGELGLFLRLIAGKTPDAAPPGYCSLTTSKHGGEAQVSIFHTQPSGNQGLGLEPECLLPEEMGLQSLPGASQTPPPAPGAQGPESTASSSSTLPTQRYLSDLT